MKHDGLLEDKGYYIHVFTEQVDDGWIGWATFERVKDVDEQKGPIRGIRHRIGGRFGSREEAAAAVRAFSAAAIDSGGVDL